MITIRLDNQNELSTAFVTFSLSKLQSMNNNPGTK